MVGWPVVGAILAMSIFGACGDGESQPRSAGSSSVPRPADGEAGIGAEQEVLRGDLAAIHAYGEARPDAWAGVRYVNEPTIRLQAAFAKDVDNHRAAIRELVEFPDRVEVVEAVRTRAELVRIRTEIEQLLEAETPNPMLSLGEGWLQVDLQLVASAEPVAELVHRRYGDAVAITVGSFPYPRRADGPSAPCPEVPATTGRVASLEVELRLPGGAQRSGDAISAALAVTNTGIDEVALSSDEPIVGHVLTPAGDRVVGVYTGAIAGTGLAMTLAPGATQEVAVIIGTASCDPTLGYLLPAGPYLAVAGLPVRERSADGMPVVATIVAVPVGIELS